MGQIILWPMKKETDIRRGRHCVFLKHVHLVFVTKYRRQIFDHDATEKLRTYFSNVCADFEAERVEMDGGPDHVHLLINYPPKLAISSLVNSLKGVSSRLLRRDRPDIAVRYYDKGVLWSPGYFVSSCILTYQLDLITTISVPGFAPIFPDICYHLTHYKPAAADIPVASDNPAHYADAIRYNARTPLQGSLLPLTRLVWA